MIAEINSLPRMIFMITNDTLYVDFRDVTIESSVYVSPLRCLCNLSHEWYTIWVSTAKRS